ncbi:Uncharacterised protein [Weeksella virosa]|uniref:helix-turn-helix transcriptional regulator n=1 Tax=Weeksella virosa TaxID=1014 RepID=UPI000E089186|nr:WYL domain-containing protein [Weeksella virosa]SUP53301.1 Uncharacterised protein [Weeksella virosa]
MAKQDYIARYFNIITKLSRTPYCSYEDLYQHLEKQFEIYNLRNEDVLFSFSKRTLQRDIQEIRTILGIDILYSRKEKGYYIEQHEFASDLFLQTIEQINSFNALNMTHSLQEIVHLEKMPPQNTDFLLPIIQAIQKKRKLKFSYQKFGEEVITQREVYPLAIKQSRNRWYLIAQEKDLQKVFGLERMLSIDLSAHRIEKEIVFNYEEKFRHCFGVISPNTELPSRVVLQFTKRQAGYIKTLPLHSSQKIVQEDDEFTTVELTIYLTQDFVTEIISYGKQVKVLEPQELIEQIKKKLKETLELYQ